MPGGGRLFVMSSYIHNRIFILKLFILLFFACSSNKPLTVENSPQIYSIYQIDNSEEIKDLGNDWFEVVGRAIIQNITPEEARNQAILDACKKTLEYYSGVEISIRTLDIKAESQNEILLDHFSYLSRQATEGIILDKIVLHEKIVTDGTNMIKTVILKLKVGKQKGERDPYFDLEANLNREYFKNGEDLELTIKTSKHCYLTILNISSNDSVYVIFPNQYNKENFLESGQVFHLPSESEKEIGLHFPVELLPGKDEDIEMIKVIATKEKIDFTLSYSFSAYGSYKSALKDLQEWLLEIPRNEIVEVDLQYFIVK